jgi:hypothetical protein
MATSKEISDGLDKVQQKITEFKEDVLVLVRAAQRLKDEGRGHLAVESAIKDVERWY